MDVTDLELEQIATARYASGIIQEDIPHAQIKSFLGITKNDFNVQI